MSRVAIVSPLPPSLPTDRAALEHIHVIVTYFIIL